jgi:hypothetical protein
MMMSTSWDESREEECRTAMAHLTYSVQELQRREEHRNKYNDFIR